MITAIDTNILLDILVPNEDFYERSASALQHAVSEGSLVVSDIVYAELCIHFETQENCEAFRRVLIIVHYQNAAMYFRSDDGIGGQGARFRFGRCRTAR